MNKYPDLTRVIKTLANGPMGEYSEVRVRRIVEQDCSHCDYDPVRKSSTDPSCQYCGGRGMIQEEKTAKIPALVNSYTSRDDLTIPGVSRLDTLRFTVDRRTAFVYKEYLAPKMRVYIDNDIYEIDGQIAYGILNKDIQTFTCSKITDPVLGVL